ncbi:hypothetical protein FA15DRAFT_675871 [Coprinopsis marcescibilis]|uniref:Uncharacterized protein n=1 Tax=Coprinopsis marcescibilis TaxID=230819 RepID=A0A5C3KCT2_COPMA|nr:hypothetical protein FA15DRAFT_675871 [Coprinopsis marcescibilis]
MSYPVMYIGLLLACTLAALSGIQHNIETHFLCQMQKGKLVPDKGVLHACIYNLSTGAFSHYW